MLKLRNKHFVNSYKLFRCTHIGWRMKPSLALLVFIHVIIAAECSNQIQTNAVKMSAINKLVAVACSTCGKDTALKIVAKPGPNRFVP
jgi:hypothetical protein